MNAIVKHEPAPETSAILSMVERAASDPNFNIENLERLIAMQERALTRQAQIAFDDAMAEMQPELPSIGERGDANGRYKFALWEDINAAIKPVLNRFGFALSFRTDTRETVTVTGILSHKAGHREETAITLPTDPSGNKNAVQAVASSVAYGKRYTAGALLNLTSHGEDDDAFSAGKSCITEEQEIELRDLAEASEADMPAFLKYIRAGSLADIASKDYQKAKSALNAKIRAKHHG